MKAPRARVNGGWYNVCMRLAYVERSDRVAAGSRGTLAARGRSAILADVDLAEHGAAGHERGRAAVDGDPGHAARRDVADVDAFPGLAGVPAAEQDAGFRGDGGSAVTVTPADATGWFAHCDYPA